MVLRFLVVILSCSALWSASAEPPARVRPINVALDPSGRYLAVVFSEEEDSQRYRVDLWRLQDFQKTGSHTFTFRDWPQLFINATASGEPMVSVDEGRHSAQAILLQGETLEPSPLSGERIRASAKTRSILYDGGDFAVIDTHSGAVERVLGGWGSVSYRHRIKDWVSTVDDTALSPDGERALVAADNHGVHLRDVRTNRVLEELPTPHRKTFSLGFLDSDQIWVAGCERWLDPEREDGDDRCRDQQLLVWSLSESRAITEIALGSRPPISSALMLDDGTLVTARCKKAEGSDRQDAWPNCGSADATVLERWNLTDASRTTRLVVPDDDEKPLRRVEVGDAAVWLSSASLNPSTSPAVVLEDRVFQWLRPGKEPMALDIAESRCAEAWELRGERLYVLGCEHFATYVLSRDGAERVEHVAWQEMSEDGEIGAVDVRVVGDTIVVLKPLGLSRFRKDGEALVVFEGLDEKADHVAISPDGRLAALSWYYAPNYDVNADALDTVLEIWNLETGYRVLRWDYGREEIHGLAFTVSGDLNISVFDNDDIETTHVRLPFGTTHAAVRSEPTRDCESYDDRLWCNDTLTTLGSDDASISVPEVKSAWLSASMGEGWLAAIEDGRVWLWPWGAEGAATLVADGEGRWALVHPTFLLGDPELAEGEPDLEAYRRWY